MFALSPSESPHPMPRKSTLWQQILSFDRPKMDLWVGLRSAMGITLALSIAMAWGPEGAGLYAALGALNVCFSDSNESYRRRARRMAVAALVSSTFVLLASVAANVPALAMAVLIAASFVAGFLVVLDNGSADIATVAVATFVIFSIKGMEFSAALHYGLYALLGGALQAAISLFLWPVRRYRTERRALANLYEQLADMALATVPLNDAPVLSAQATKAQDVLSSIAGDMRTEARRYRSLLSQAERIRVSLLSLKRLQMRLLKENQAHEGALLIGGVLTGAARSFLAVGKALRSRHLSGVGPSYAAEMDQMLKSVRTFDASGDTAFFKAVMTDVIYQCEALGGQMRAAIELTVKTTTAGELLSEEAEAARPLRLQFWGVLATLRANAHFSSPGFRHAVRLAVSVAIGEALSHSLSVERAYWIPMTILIVLKPDYGATFSRGVLRVLGTLAGLGVATLIYALLPPTPAVAIPLAMLFTLLTRWAGAANYGIFAMGVAGLVVSLVSLLGVAPEAVIYARGINTCIGGVVALAIFRLWPTWEKTQLSEVVARLLDSYRAYLQAITARLIEGAGAAPAELDRTRLAGRAARSNFQASMVRYVAERGADQETCKQLSAILASSNRVAHAMMSLEAAGGLAFSTAERQALRVFSEAACVCLRLLSEKLRGGTAGPKDFPNLRQAYGDLITVEEAAGKRYGLVADEADRLTNSLNTLREQIQQRLAGKNKRAVDAAT